MTATIEDVRDSIADAVATTGIRCHPYVLDQVSPPVAMVNRRGMDPRMVLGATKNVYRFEVVVFASRQSEIAGQKLIDNYAATTGTSSIKVAVEDGSNWTATVDYATVTNIGDTVEREIAGVVYLTVAIELEVCW